MSHTPPPLDLQLADELNRQIGVHLMRLRLEQKRSAYELAVPGLLSDQSILNIESGLINPGLRTVALYCQRLGTTLQAVIVLVVVV